MIPLLAPRVMKSQKRSISPGRATKSLEDDLCATAKTEGYVASTSEAVAYSVLQAMNS